jgi:hypothetical protein
MKQRAWLTGTEHNCFADDGEIDDDDEFEKAKDIKSGGLGDRSHFCEETRQNTTMSTAMPVLCGC